MRQYRWFNNRVGKRVYRKPINWCDCSNCKNASVKIRDKEHAYSLFIHSFELDIRFYDKLEFLRLHPETKEKVIKTSLRKCICGDVFYSRFSKGKFCKPACRINFKKSLK